MNIKELLFWLFLVMSIILLLWYLFGNSPTEFLTIISIILMIIFKTWSISDRLIRLEMKSDALNIRMKESFSLIKQDMSLIKKKLKIYTPIG